MGDFWGDVGNNLTAFFGGDVGNNLTAFFGGTTPEKVRAQKRRVQAFQDAGKPAPSITRDNNAFSPRPGVDQPFGPRKPVVDKPPQSVIDEVVRRNTLRPGEYQSPTRQGNDDIPESTYRDGPPPPSPLEILMGHLAETYQGSDPSKMDFSSLDKALGSRVDALNAARDRMRGNFDQSDNNLRMMHDAFQHQVQTEDAARYNQIADTEKGNFEANRASGVGNLEAARAKQVAERQAMLKNLGIEAAGAAEDKGLEGLNSGIDTINQRNNINQNQAEAQRANNLSYNNTVAQSIGQAGVQRRAALAQQLQGLLGKADMAEADAKANYESEKQKAISGAQDIGYKQWNDQQDRYLGMFNTLSGQELQREKMAQDQANQAGPKSQGLAAIADDLTQSGVDPGAAQNGLAALGRILSSGNYLQGANGPDGNTPYDKANIIIQKLKGEGVDPMTATQIGIRYANM